MRSALLRNTLIFLFLIANKSILFAQSDVFNHKLDSLKDKDNLSEWLYEKLNYLSAHPNKVSALTQTNKLVWRQPKTDVEKFAWIDYLNSIGYYQLLSGQILDAINSYESALGYFERNKTSLKNYEIIEYTLKPLSNNYTRLGDYERALFLQKKSIAILKTRHQIEALPAIYCNLAISYRSMGNLSEAEKTVQEGIKIAKPNNGINILLINIYADILFDQNQLQKAKSLIEKNIVKQKNINLENAYWLMSSYTTAGEINLKLNNYNIAESYFSRALSIINKYFNGLRLREKANLLTQLGKTKLKQNKPLIAIHYFNSTLNTLKITGNNTIVNINKVYGENKLMDVFEQMANAYLSLKKPDDAFKNIQFALITADKIRNEFADDKTKERLQADTKNIAERGIEICYDQYIKTSEDKYLTEILNLSEQSKSRTLLDQIQRNQMLLSANKKDSLFIKKLTLERAIIFNERKEIESKKINKNTDELKFDLALINKKIKEKYKQFNLDAYSGSISQSLNKLQNTRIIEYFFGRNSIYILNIKDRKINHIEKIDKAERVKSSIEKFTNTYFQNGPNAILNAPDLFFKASYGIYKTILPNTSFIQNEKVIIIPDGVLGYISFDGLITNPNYSANISGWPFLIKRNIITYAFSIKTIISSKAEVTKKDFTGLFITLQKNNKPLLAVQAEANAIKKIVKGKFLFNDEVTPTSFSRAFEESKILHIGTHAYLSGKNAEPTLDFEKEKIYLFELVNKKNTPQLVVLSACRTADGVLANGEGIISLSRGFSAIGTPATIAGLWNVNDNVASVITSHFYKHLIDKKSNGEALHLAKIEWLNTTQNADAMYLPYYWDSLIYIGVDQTINLKSATNWTGIFIGFSLITLLLLSGFIILKLRKMRPARKV